MDLRGRGCLFVFSRMEETGLCAKKPVLIEKETLG